MDEAREVSGCLRQIADWLEANADTLDCDRVSHGVTYLWCDTPEQFASCAKALGKFRKDASGSYFNASRFFGPIELQATIGRENLCRRIVHKRIEPAKPAMLIEAQPEREVEVIEYECPESILALAAED